MKKKLLIAGAIVLALAIFVMSPLWPYVRSLAAMKLFSAFNERESLMAEKGIEIEIPGGKATEEQDWYPFVMTFSADERFAMFCGDSKARLTIMYNFPAFDLSAGCSLIFDEESPYYNSFYGAYVADGKLGFAEDGSFEAEQASLVPRFDMKELVLEDMGMSSSDFVFDWQLTAQEEDLTLAGFDGWSRVDADMVVNGVLHTPISNYRNYIQYGRPGYEAEADFAPVSMQGRVYARYFAEQDVSIYFYIMVRSAEVLEACDREFIAKSKIMLSDK